MTARSQLLPARLLIYAASIVIVPSGRSEWSWLRNEADWLRDESRPSRNKAARIVPISRLRRLGLRLLDQVDRCPLSVSAALDYRDALMVLQLTFKPIRISNLAEMRFGHNLVLGDHGGSLFFARTKNGASDGHPIPPELAKRFRRYRDHYRPAIAGAADTDQVWVSKLGGKLTGPASSQATGEPTSFPRLHGNLYCRARPGERRIGWGVARSARWALSRDV
jgi:hypothetical protein